MLHELLDLRQRLESSIESVSPLSRGTKGDSVYQHKLEIIQNNLYGVDIDVFAVNIARLRLWLSLAVDYEGDRPKPLPNLKYKIDVGDSLISPNPTEIKLTDVLIKKYRQIKAEYIKTHNGDRKKVLDKEITKLKKEISLITYGKAPLDKGGSGGFDWSLDFAEVFADGGFDVIVANPPYVRMELFKDIKPTLKKNFPEVHSDRADLYCYFYGRAFQLLRKGGMLTFISSNKWLKAKYGAKLRKHIANDYQIHSIIDFGDLPVFKSATAYPMIFIAENIDSVNESFVFTKVDSLESPYPAIKTIVENKGHKLSTKSLNGSNWILTDSTSAKDIQIMKAKSISLGEYIKGKIYAGIKTGFNKAFIIDTEIKNRLIAEDYKSREIIKPLALGKNVDKWNMKCSAQYLIYTHKDTDIKTFSAVYNYLSQYKQRLEQRASKQEWYELQQPQLKYSLSFDKPKIVFPDIAKKQRFTIDYNNTYIDMTAFVIPVNDLYLLGVLNSLSVYKYFIEIGAQVRGGYLRFKRQYVEQIPIPNASDSEKETISQLVQKYLDAKGVDCEVWEKEIDDRVAALYGL